MKQTLHLDMAVTASGEVQGEISVAFDAPVEAVLREFIVHEAVIGATTGVPYYQLNLVGGGMQAQMATNTSQSGSLMLVNNQSDAQPDGAGGQFYYSYTRSIQTLCWGGGKTSNPQIRGFLTTPALGANGQDFNRNLAAAPMPSRLTLVFDVVTHRYEPPQLPATHSLLNTGKGSAIA